MIANQTRKDFESEIDESIHKYWSQNAKPNPYAHLKRKVVTLETGQQEDHPHHNLDGYFKIKYEDWKKQNAESSSKCKKIPFNYYFQKLRRKLHPCIYKTPITDFSNCYVHYNYKSIIKHCLIS